MSDVIRVFVGCAANWEDAESQAVLEWSIRKHASREVAITWMKLSRDPSDFYYSDGAKGWQTSMWATPFSGFRWSIPAACGFEGRAIYCDSDFIFMDDIAKLYDQEFAPGKSVMAKGRGSWRYCCSLWDCAAVKPHMMPIEELRSNPASHKLMSARFAGASWAQPFEGNWNCLDGERFTDLYDPAIKAIHYTVMANQPHLEYAIPRLKSLGMQHWFNGEVKPHWRKDLVDMFGTLLNVADAKGFTVESYCREPLYGEYRKQDLSRYRGRAA